MQWRKKRQCDDSKGQSGKATNEMSWKKMTSEGGCRQGDNSGRRRETNELNQKEVKQHMSREWKKSTYEERSQGNTQNKKEVFLYMYQQTLAVSLATLIRW